MKEPLTWRESQLIMQAQIWKMEARAANHTIGQIYQLVTGATGEPGNWHGAEPVRALIAENGRLRDLLFKIQCEQLDRGTNKLLSADTHRRLAMKTRDEIIAGRAAKTEVAL